jgi:hypothetical protein
LRLLREPSPEIRDYRQLGIGAYPQSENRTH